MYSGNLCNSALNSYTYAAVDNLDKYQEIGVNFRIGDALTMEERFNANTFSQKTYSAYASDTYNGRIAIFVNFEKNLVGIKTISKAGWDYQYLSITNIYGYLRK